MRPVDIWSFLISVAVFGVVVFWSRLKPKEQPQGENKRRQLPRLSKSQEQLHRRLWKGVKWTVATGAAVLAFLAVVDQFWGRPWPSAPEIHPHDVLNGSSLRLPFTIKNSSIWGISNAEMTCGIDWVYFKDVSGTKANFFQIAFVNDVLSIPAGVTVNYECDASELIRVNPDGSWMLRTMTGPLRFQPPLDFGKMCLWIRGDYKIADFMPWNFTSTMFEWPAAPGVPQWLEGPTYRQGQLLQDDWIARRATLPPYADLPASAVTCSPEPHVAAMTFNRDGTVTLNGHRLKLPGTQ